MLSPFIPKLCYSGINKIVKFYWYSQNTAQLIIHTDTFIHTHPHSHTITKLYSSSQPKTYTSQHNPSHTHTHLAQEHDPSSTLSLKPQKPAFHNIIHHTLRLTYFKNSIQLTLWVKNPEPCTPQQYSAHIHTYILQNTHTYWYTHTHIIQ